MSDETTTAETADAAPPATVSADSAAAAGDASVDDDDKNGAAQDDTETIVLARGRRQANGSGDPEDGDDASGKGGDDADTPSLLDGDAWRAKINRLPDELKDQVGRYTSEFEAFRALVEAKKALRSRVRIPDKMADPEEIAEFRRKLGVPEKAEGYEIDIPDDLDDEVRDATGRLIDRLHKAGATVDVARNVIDAVLYEQSEAERRFTETLKSQADEAEQRLRKLWGEDFNKQVSLAERFLMRLSPELGRELQDMRMADGRVLGNHPQFVELLNLAARSISEDAISPPARVANNESITADTIRSYYVQHYDAISNPSHPEHRKRVDEYNEIARIVASREPGGNVMIGPTT